MSNPIELIKRAHYDGMKTEFSESKWIYFGAPFDGTSSYRAGSRFGPEEIRQETLLCQETYSSFFDFDIADSSISDVGNLDLPFGNVLQALSSIKQYTDYIIEHNKHPFMVGGEHLVTLPVIQSLINKYPDLKIIHLDAHADMADDVFGERLSHGTVMRRIFDIIGPERIFQFGIRSGSKIEIDFAKKHNYCNLFDLNIPDDWILKLENSPIYFTVDLDCFDPSQIPGTGTPETGGVFFREFIPFLNKISHLNFVGMDVNELAPRIDPTSMSTVFAAKIVREMIASCIR